MSLAYIRRCYGVPAIRGRRVMIDGDAGTIVGARGASLRIRFDGEKRSQIAHPTWRVTYLQRTGGES